MCSRILALPPALDGVGEIVHTHVPAVVELHTRSQCKCIAQAVLRFHDLRSHRRHNLTVRTGLNQALEDVEQDFLGSCRRHVIGVKTVEVLGNADTDFVGCRSCVPLYSGCFRGFHGRFRGRIGCCCGRRCGLAAASGQKHGQYKGKCQNCFLHGYSFHHCPVDPGQCAVPSGHPGLEERMVLGLFSFQTLHIIHEAGVECKEN